MFERFEMTEITSNNPWMRFTSREAMIYLPISKINHIYKPDNNLSGKATEWGALWFDKGDGEISTCEILMIPEATKYYRNFHEIFENKEDENESEATNSK